MPTFIRLATPADIPALERLIFQSVRALSASYYSPQQNVLKSLSATVFGFQRRGWGSD